MKRMLAYSSVAHTGFLLTGLLGVQAASALGTDEITSLQAVLFYLATYGLATVGTFAIVTLVRDAGGEATAFSKWAGLGKRSPLVAGAFGFLLLSMAGIPLTGGFVGKWAVFAVALSAGAWPVVIVGDPAQHHLGVLLRPGDPADVLRRAGADDRGEVAAVTHAVAADLDDDRGLRRGHAAAGRRPRPGARPGRECGTIHQVSSTRARAWPCRSPTPTSRRGCARRMDEVEKALYGHVQSRFPFVTEAASHLLDAGGKRFRPLLVLLAAEAGEHPDVDDVITAACVVEITHLGSLYHDDVMDEADLRRGSPSANARWDNLVAILTGDFLFAKSSELTAQLGADAVRIQAETFTRLVEGQILETVEPGPDEDPLAHYLEVVAGKTGSLIATSARYGARFGGATPEVEEALAAYGEIVGSAFQLSDDIIDIASDSVESGKTPGTDLREGVPTLPVLMAQASDRPRPTPGCSSCSAGDLTDDELHAEALDLLRKHPAMDEARAYVVARATEAKALLDVLPDGPVRDALEAFADIVATRPLTPSRR